MQKKYSVNIENDEILSVEVDGVVYSNPEEIPDDQDRETVQMLIARSETENTEELFDEKEFEAEFRRLEQETAHFPNLILAIFLGISVLLLAISAFSAYNAVQTQAREEPAPGKVVEMVMRSSRDSETGQIKEYFYPVVEFAVPGQAPRTVQIGEGSWPPAYAVGDQVTVLYHPQRPNNARIQSFSSNLLLWLLPGITGLVGLAFAIASLAVFRFGRPSPTQPAVI
jgi:hypothetical protein